MSDTSTPTKIVLSSANLALLVAASQEYKDSPLAELSADLSAAVNLLFPFGISRYKALAKDAQKRGSHPPGSNPEGRTRAPRGSKTVATRSAVTEALEKELASPKGRKQLDLPSGEKPNGKSDAKPEPDMEASKEKAPTAAERKAAAKEEAKIASLEAAKAAEAEKAAKASNSKSNGKIAASAKKTGKKDEPDSKGNVWWIVKIGKQEVQVSAHKDDRDGAVKEALSQIPGAKLSMVKSAEIEVE